MRIQENIASEFNEFATNYTSDMIACVPHYLDLISSFSKDLPSGFSVDNLLDLGCGNGNVTNEMLRSFPEAHYHLLDASDKMLELCEQRFAGRTMSFISSYFADYEFPREFFDMIVAGFSIHHCDAAEKQQLFRSCYQALKPGGIFGFSDLMIDRTKAEHDVLLQEWKVFVRNNFPDDEKWEWLMEHYNEFDKPDHFSDQFRWLEEAGFSEVSFVFREGHWVHLRASK
ncbi:MAG: class I SAM-dependent methyltransferase [Bacteroidota bacterium]